MYAKLRTLIERVEERPLTLGAWALTILAIILIRIGIENVFVAVPFRFADQFFTQFSHHFLTFTTIFLVALPIVAWAGQSGLRAAANVLTIGFLVIWTPPMVDEIISRGHGLWSFYSFDSLLGLLERYVTFFGDKPDVGITYGVRFEIGIVVLFIGLYTWFKSRSISRSILAGLLLYTALFLIGVLPSIVTLLLLGPQVGFLAVTEHDIVRVMLSPAPLFIINPPDVASVLAVKMSLIYAALLAPLTLGLVFKYFRNMFWALFHNARFPQILYHLGLFLIGAALAGLYSETSFRWDIFHIAGVIVLLYAVVCAWLASVVVNDLRDTAIDRVSNPTRPLITGAIATPTYQTIGILFFSASVFLAALVSTQAALLLILYQALAWLYSAAPLRLKTIPLVATVLAAFASLLVLFAGFIVFSADKNISALPVTLSTFLFLAYFLLLPIKDFKDLAGDRLDGVTTLPLLLGETRAKRFIGSLAFLFFIASVFILDLRSFFPLALFFGTLAYWILHSSSADHRTFTYRALPAWYIALITGYVALLALHYLRSLS